MHSDFDIHQHLLTRYGLFLTVEEVAEVFRYPSASAVRQAHAAGRRPVPLLKFSGRRALFADAEDVAAVVAANRKDKPGERLMAK